MNIKSRLEKAEGRHAAQSEPEVDARGARWVEAYAGIAGTMAAEDFESVHVELIAFLKTGGPHWRVPPSISFVAARVLSLVERAANRLPVGLQMPPALAEAWRDFEAKCLGLSSEELFRARFDFQSCASCGAEHPWLGRYEWDRPGEVGRRMYLSNESEVIKTCLVCGGVVGQIGRPTLQAA